MRSSFNMAETNITMVKGDTLSFNFQIEGLDGGDLSSAYFTVKANPKGNLALIQKSIGNGISKVDEGLYVVRVAPDDTENLDAGMLWYDLQIGIGEDIYTVLLGMLEILQDVTN